MARLPSQLTYNDLNGREAVDILTDWFRQLLSNHQLLQPHLTLPMAVLSLDIGVKIEMYVGGTVPVSSPPEVVVIDGKITMENKLSAVVNAAPIPGGLPPDKVREQHGLPVSRPGYGDRSTGSHLFLSDVVSETERGRHADVARRMGSGQPPDGPSDAPSGGPSASGGRTGIVADGYVFSSEPVGTSGASGTVGQPLAQTIQLANGAIEIDLAGCGITHAGMLIKDDSHRKSEKQFGDQRGDRYSSVNGVMDAGPAGLMNRRGGGGLGTDGRARLSFGNNNKG